MKRIAVDLAKSVYQVAESVRSGQVIQRKRLNREAFKRYIQEQAEPVEGVMEVCDAAHHLIGGAAMSGPYAGETAPAAALGGGDSGTHWPQQSGRGPGQQTGADLLGGVVP